MAAFGAGVGAADDQPLLADPQPLSLLAAGAAAASARPHRPAQSPEGPPGPIGEAETAGSTMAKKPATPTFEHIVAACIMR